MNALAWVGVGTVAAILGWMVGEAIYQGWRRRREAERERWRKQGREEGFEEGFEVGHGTQKQTRRIEQRARLFGR